MDRYLWHEADNVDGNRWSGFPLLALGLRGGEAYVADAWDTDEEKQVNKSW